tara:strand:+ start:137 stop:943 length:807 start_codon:yes stop_codon:yes gene_type:complete
MIKMKSNQEKDIRPVVNLNKYPLSDRSFINSCRVNINRNGSVVLTDFLTESAVKDLIDESVKNQEHAYYCRQEHSVYILPNDEDLPSDHPRNRLVVSSKGCITDDQIPNDSSLKLLYRSDIFKQFVANVVGEKNLYEYEDKLSSVNIHYASEGQELGWHFDNSSFAVTLLIQQPESGGEFQYIRDFRDTDKEDMNYEGVDKLLKNQISYDTLNMNSGTLVLFRGKNSIHRVTPVEGEKTRILAVLAYNSEPNISLSETSRMTFYGRLD